MMKHSPCITPGDMARTADSVYRAHNSDEIPPHVAGCEKCRESLDAQLEIVKLAKELPGVQLSEARSNSAFWAVRHQLGQKKAPQLKKRRSWYIAIAAAFIVGGILLGIFVFQTERAASRRLRDVAQHLTGVYRGHLHGNSGVEYELVSSQPDEIVRLFNGTLTLNVDPLKNSERFRLITGDAEIEVVGTAFDVVVKDDSLVSVRVINGVVDVRPLEAQSVRLGPDDIWKASTVSNEKPLERVAQPDVTLDERNGTNRKAISSDVGQETHLNQQRKGDNRDRLDVAFGAKRKQQVVDESTGTVESDMQDIEAVFAKAWLSLKHERYDTAAIGFKKVISSDGDRGIREDAAYWLGVCLEHAHRFDDAETAYRFYLKNYPDGDMVPETVRSIDRVRARIQPAD